MTWLQVAKVIVLAYTVVGTAESVWCLWESKTQLGDNIHCDVKWSTNLFMNIFINTSQN
jgi:hypothetical protein